MCRPAQRGGFGITPVQAEAMEPPVGLSGIAAASLLAVQEDESGARQDRDARQHGEAVVDALGELQRALLGGDGPDLARLSQLVRRPVVAADPRLAAVLRSVRLRAEVELARRMRGAGEGE